MKKLLIMTIIICMSLLIILSGCWDKQYEIEKEQYESEKAQIKALEEEMTKNNEESEVSIDEDNQVTENSNGNEEKNSGESDISISSQSGTLTFNESNSELEGSIQANITKEYGDNGDHKSTMVFTTGRSQMDKNPTIFDITLIL